MRPWFKANTDSRGGDCPHSKRDFREHEGTSGSRSRFLPDRTIEGGAEIIRDLFIAFVVLILTVTATTWLNVSPHLSVQQVEASLAR